jgi:hypothetical protein
MGNKKCIPNIDTNIPGKQRNVMKININIDLKEIGCEGAGLRAGRSRF